MKALLANRNALVWALLLIATFAQTWIGASGAYGMAAAMGLLAIAALKSRWVILDFMGIRHTRPFWQRILGAWLLLAVALIVAGFWVGAR